TPGPVGHAVDDQAAHAADALAAVAVEGDRLLALLDELLVEDVEHLQEGHIRLDVIDRVVFKTARLVGARLPPDPQVILHRHRPFRPTTNALAVLARSSLAPDYL